MCGFISYDQATITSNEDWFARLGDISSQLKKIPSYSAYPAFGGDTNKRIPLVVNENSKLRLVDAIWWFDGEANIRGQTQLGKLTSFNARNLERPFWKSALKRHRGIVLASSIGESKLVGKTKHQYLMQSHQGFLLGALYRKLDNGDYLCAIITRDAHPKMAPYHDKAFPLFLPNQEGFIATWLNAPEQVPNEVKHLLAEPKLFPNLHVKRVKSYKSAQPVGNVMDNLQSDAPELLA